MEAATLLARSYRRSTIPLLREETGFFTLLQFNTLANSLSDAFPYVNGDYLKWEHRKQLLIREILQHKPDVIAVEEVDKENYKDYFRPFLTEAGFKGIFKKKVAEDSKDGGALFYNTKMFSLENKRKLRYMENNSQIAIITLLKGKEGAVAGREICVVVTHLKSKVGNEERRLQQGKILLKAIEEFVGQSGHVPVFVMGDFNDVPGSLVYNYFKRQVSHKDGEQEKLVEDTSLHPFELKSAYSAYQSSGEEPYTTFKKREKEVCRTIDYIWYSPSRGVEPLHLLEIPSIDALPNRLPACNYPSDHLAIAASFVLSKPSSL